MTTRHAILTYLPSGQQEMGETFITVYDDDIWFVTSVRIDSCDAVVGCVELEAISEFVFTESLPSVSVIGWR
jgi:hypothetical protein